MQIFNNRVWALISYIIIIIIVVVVVVIIIVVIFIVIIITLFLEKIAKYLCFFSQQRYWSHLHRSHIQIQNPRGPSRHRDVDRGDQSLTAVDALDDAIFSFFPS